jgi:hypothetical protein
MPERSQDPVYFTDAADVRYRVLDATMRDGRWVYANPPASWAAYRLFRPAEGQRRLYRFTAGEPRAPDGAELERQLRRAEFMPSQPVRTFQGDPR